MKTARNTSSTRAWHLKKGSGFWRISHAGQTEVVKHEIGLDYVAYLMDRPFTKFQGLALTLKIRAARKGAPESDDIVQERALALDDAEAVRRLFFKQLELKQIASDKNQVPVARAEAARALREIRKFQNKRVLRTSCPSSRAAHAVGTAIKRLYHRLASTTDDSDQPNGVLRDFAEHIRQHILLPSGRPLRHGGLRLKAAAGFFIYSPGNEKRHAGRATIT